MHYGNYRQGQRSWVMMNIDDALSAHGMPGDDIFEVARLLREC